MTDGEYRRRVVTRDKRKMRNLVQFRDMTDEEFDEYLGKKELGAVPMADFERRIERRLEQYSEDYDIDDLKINDMQALRSLIQAELTLEDYEQLAYKARVDGVNDENLTIVDKLTSFMRILRADISKLQDDLQITRKSRKGDKEESTIKFIENLKEKAKTFYESRTSYVFCRECNMLLGNVWFNNSQANNTVRFTCHRVLDNGEICNTVTTVSSKELVKNRGTNNVELMPESML